MADTLLALKLASENIAKAQIAQKRMYDCNTREVDFVLGNG